MILNCKSYITKNETLDIWRDEKPSVISRMKDCINLYHQYYESYKVMLKNIEEADERLIEVSEMYVFGKFDKFKTRLNKVSPLNKLQVSQTMAQTKSLNIKLLFFSSSMS